MDDSITPPEEDVKAGADDALPADQPTDEADSKTAEPTDDKGAEETAVPEVDDKLKAYAESKGIALDSDGAVKAAKIAMDNQAEFQRSRQKASELEKSLRSDINTAAAAGDTDQVTRLTEQVNELTMVQNINAFFSEGSTEQIAEKKALEPVMAKMVTDDPNLGALVKQGYINYDQLFAMAKGSDSSRDAKLKTDGGREALQKVADKQSAKAVAGSATTSELSADKDEDPFMKGFNKSNSS